MGIVMRSLGQDPTDAQLEAMVNGVDANGNGTIDYAEFISFMLQKKREGEIEAELKDTFRIFDRGNTGHINFPELRHLLTSFGEKLSDEEVDDVFNSCKVLSNYLKFAAKVEKPLRGVHQAGR